MELISKGGRHPDTIYEGQCTSCDSVFTCKRSELTNIKVDEINCLRDSSLEICPECGGGKVVIWHGILFKRVEE